MNLSTARAETRREKLKFNSSRVEIIINARSGAGDKEAARATLLEIFAAGGVEANIRLAQSGAEIVRIAEEAARGDAQIIVAGGGDGTIAAVAQTLVGADKIFGVLPLGTFNYFARNLGVPLDLEAAARNLMAGEIKSVAVGEVNGRVFLNNASLGLYPAILRRREGVYRRWGRSRPAAYFSVALALLRPAAFLRLRLEANGERTFRKTPLVFVGNNDYQLEEFNLGGRACLAEDALAFFITKPVGRFGMLRLALRGLFRRLRDAEDFQTLCLREAQIETRRKRLRVAMDGEVFRMKTPLRFRLLPDALRVIVPAANRIADAEK